MTKQILCTIGPASQTREIISRFEELGVSLLRINLSHSALDDVARTIEFIQNITSVPICLDTEGAQIRTGHFVENSVPLRENSLVTVHNRMVPGDSSNIYFHPLGITGKFEVGDIISIDFNSVLAQVVNCQNNGAVLRILSGGIVGRNKAVTVEREITLPPLSQKDILALKIGNKMGIGHFALSFANRAEDVKLIRTIVGPDAFIISKIESRGALNNLHAIAAESSALLIDRGDLSREIPIESIPPAQKEIIRQAKLWNVPVYVATNLLESMVSEPVPTRAEVNDIYNTLSDGADGLVLAAETAIGDHPVRCASMIVKMVRQFEKGGDEDGSYHFDPVSLLVEPHGGRLVHREANLEELVDIDSCPSLIVDDKDLMDCEQIALGTYSPLTGFMDSQTLESVLDEYHLPDGNVWTMPLVLQVDARSVSNLSTGQKILLKSEGGLNHSILDVSEIYSPNLNAVAEKWYGTSSDKHPGVNRFKRDGDRFIAGAVTLIRRLPSEYRHYELTPVQSRSIFTHKGWSKVVGFHGRNPPHGAHQFIQAEALQRVSADGLYLSPAIGLKKQGDFLASHILNSYRLLLDFGHFEKGKVLLGSFATYSRYCGPREAVFTALCRKNMGCSHFIIGRDHAGIQNFYPEYGNVDLFEMLGDIGIKPVFFGTVGFNRELARFEEVRSGAKLEIISGSIIREKLSRNERMPEWFMSRVVQDMLLDEIAAGRPLFYT